MRKGLLLLLGLLLLQCPTKAAHVIVVTTGSPADSATDATTPAVDTSGATFLIVSCSWFSGPVGGGDSSVTDSKGNTWAGVSEIEFITGDGPVAVQLWYVNSATPTVGSGHTFTCTTTNDGFPVIGVIAASGGTSSPFDQQNSNTGSSISTLDHAGGIVPTVDNTMVVTGIVTYGASLSIDSGYTAAFVTDASGSSMGGGIAYLLQGTAASTNPSWSWTSSTSTALTIASFKSASGGGGGAGPCTLATTGAGRC